MSEVKRYYLWVESYGGSQEMLEHNGEELPSQDLHADGSYRGFNHEPLYVLASDYDAALSQLAALREELATSKRNEHNSEVAYKAAIEKQDELRDRKNSIVDLQQRLADAERRNVSLLEVARGLTIQLHATIGNTELHEYCLRDLKALEAADE